MTDLGINRRMLQRSRLILQEKGVIDFVPGIGQAPTEYLILDTILAPERVDKKRPRVDKMRRETGHNVHSLYKKSYEYSKDKKIAFSNNSAAIFSGWNFKKEIPYHKIHFGKFIGMSVRDRIILKQKGLL